MFERRILLQREQICRAFHHLVKVGSHETVRERQLVLHSVEIVAGLAQVVHGGTHLVECERHEHLFLRLEARQPEVVLQSDLLERDRLEHLVA